VREASDGELMARLFDGRRDIYGINKGRVERCQTGDWTSTHWETLFDAHVAGKEEADLGIYLVRDDDTVTFAAIDIDEPNFPLALEVAQTMPDAVPWIEQSRSGNYHVFVFFDEPLEAYYARAVLRGVIIACGRPDLEIFPKQDGLREGMVGNYISIPWHGYNRPIVSWLPDAKDEDGRPRPIIDNEPEPREWMLEALSNRTSAEAWRRRGRALGGKPRSETRSGEFGERNSLHVCASYIFEHRHDNPLTEGHRATVLFNLAKMYANCKHYSQDEAEQFVEAVNQAGTNPVPPREVKRFVNNAYEGGFTSTGCDDPLMTPYVSPDCKIANG
jgi:hypothetical protein